MPANYPSSVYSPRTKANKSGVVYDPAQTTKLYAEDVSKLDDEVVALENSLPLTTAKTFVTQSYDVELEDGSTKYLALENNSKQSSYSDIGTYLGPGHLSNIHVTLATLPAVGEHAHFGFYKNGVLVGSLHQINNGDPASFDVALNIDIAPGDIFQYQFSCDAGFTYTDFTGVITLTGLAANLSQELASLKEADNFDHPIKETIIKATADQIKNNSSSFSDSTYLRAICLSNHVYTFEFFLIFDLKAASDVKFQISTSGEEDYVGYLRAAQAATTAPIGAGSSQTILVTSPGKFIEVLKGIVWGQNTSFDFRLQFAQNTAQVEDTKLLKGSYVKVIDHGAIA